MLTLTLIHMHNHIYTHTHTHTHTHIHEQDSLLTYCGVQDCGNVTLYSLVCSPDGVRVVDRIARECQLSREVVARLLCKVDTRKNGPFAEPLLMSVGTRLNQLSARKRVTRSRSDNNECEESGVGTRGGVGGGVGGARKGWSLDVNTLKRQRKRRSTFDTTADAYERVAGKGPKRNRTHGLFLFFTFFFCLAHVFPPFFYAEIAADASWNRTSIYKYMHIYVHICSHTYKCVYTHLLYWYICICIYLHIFMHVHAHTTICI